MLVYVNWDTAEVVGPDQSEEVIERKFKEYLNDETAFSDWLYENYSLWEIWEMDDEEKVEIRKEYENDCKIDAEGWFDESFEEFEVH